MGSSQEEVRFHKLSSDVTSDEHGRAVLQIPQDSVRVLLSGGESTPNNCGSIVQELRPGQLTVFARPPSLREKMGW